MASAPLVQEPPPRMFAGTVLVAPTSTRVTCPFCQAVVKTNVKLTKTTRTYTVAGALCTFMCCLAWCALCCMDSIKNADHYCPNCKSYLGTYER